MVNNHKSHCAIKDYNKCIASKKQLGSVWPEFSVSSPMRSGG